REMVQTRLLPMSRSRSSRGAPVGGNDIAMRATSAARGSSGWKIRAANAAGVAAPSSAAPVALAHSTRLASGVHSQVAIALIAYGEKRVSRVRARIVAPGSDGIIRV